MADTAFTFGRSNMLFPTPVLTYSLPDAERVNAALLEEIAQRRARDPGVVRSNRAGWHSASDFFERSEPAHAEVSQAVRGAVLDATKRLRPPAATDPFHVQINGWINVNPPAAYNVPHDHPGSFWSGCYYIQTDPPRDENDETGAITFIDPRCAPAGQPLVRAPMFFGSHSLKPRPGSLLLFPSNVKHWVHPNAGERERVTMAFNAFILAPRPKPNQPAAARA